MKIGNNIKQIVLVVMMALLCFEEAFAKPPEYSQGHYLQVDVVHMKADQELLISQEVVDYEGYDSVYFADNTLEQSDTSYGLSYKYAFSMKDTLVEPLDRIFIAPGFFYEDVSSTAKDSLFEDTVTIDKRYGIKLDIGFDFDYGISTYFTNGVSAIEYQTAWVGFTDSLLHYAFPNYETEKYNVSGRSFAYFYGIGITYSPIESMAFILEFSQQANSIKAKPEGGYAQTDVIYGDVDSQSQFLKFGVAYHF